MPFTVPLHAKIQLNSERVEDEVVLLLEVVDLDDPSLPMKRLCSRPIERLSTDPLRYGIVSSGQEYDYMLTGTIPSDQEGGELQSQLVIDNVDQAETDWFVGLSVRNSATLKVVLASDPDTNLRDIPLMYVTNVTNTIDSLTLMLARNPVVVGASSNLEPWPSGLQNIINAPGLHRQ